MQIQISPEPEKPDSLPPGFARVEWGAIIYEVVTTALIAATVLLIFYSVFTLNVVRGNSMEPLLQDGDYVLGIRLFGMAPARGSIVILHAPKTDHDAIKRVIGLPGETVEYDGLRYQINGQPLREEYIDSASALFVTPPVTVSQGSYFLSGDNRAVSLDSRSYGPVLSEEIYSLAIMVVHPLARIRMLLRAW